MEWDNLTYDQKNAVITGDCDYQLYTFYIRRIVDAIKAGNAAKSRFYILEWF